MSDRKPRELETREYTAPRYEYVPPSTLPMPKEQDGWVFRWIGIAVLGHANPSNASQRMREGWEPVPAADVPELMLPANKQGNVEVGGLLLCKAPREMVEARNAYYRKQASMQMDSVNSTLMRESDPRMPIIRPENESDERVGSKSRSFGSGTK